MDFDYYLPNGRTLTTGKLRGKWTALVSLQSSICYINQKFLIKLTREGSKKGSIHCLPKKDRVTWGSNYIVDIYFINTKTIVKEYNKGLGYAYI